ncbi:MAG: archease [Actinomycetota bacterium]|nr:archease [Actinomycetota bacterium]
MNPERGTYELEGRGSDLAIRVAGPDAAACLAAAVEGFAASLTDVDPMLGRRRMPLQLEGQTPEDLLVGLLDEAILRLDTDGDLAVGLVDAELTGEGLQGVLEVVDLESVQVRGVAPKAATWHDVLLQQVGDAWEGQLVLDL